MIKSKVGSIKSGWRSVFMIFTAAADDELESIVESAFENVEQGRKSHLNILFTPFNQTWNSWASVASFSFYGHLTFFLWFLKKDIWLNTVNIEASRVEIFKQPPFFPLYAWNHLNSVTGGESFSQENLLSTSLIWHSLIFSLLFFFPWLPNPSLYLKLLWKCQTCPYDVNITHCN